MSHRQRLLSVLIGLICLLAASVPAAAGWREGSRYRTDYAIVAQEDNWKYSPQVAYASLHDQYLVVWETVAPGGHHEIDGRRVSPAGQLLEAFVVYSDTHNSLQPSVAYDPTHDRYLVAWSYDYYGSGVDFDILGRFIPGAGPIPAQTCFAIDVGAASTDKPRVAYASVSDRFLVVWRVLGDPSSIAGALRLNNSSIVPVAVSSSGPEVRDFPDVAYNAARDEFVAVWDVDVGRDKQDLDVYAMRLDSAGAPIAPPGEFVVANTTTNEQHPTVASCYQANQYLFAWQKQVNETSSDDNIFGRLMAGAGDLGQIYGLEGTTLPQQYPRLACNTAGSQYFLVWQDHYAQPFNYGIWAALIHTDLTVEPSFEVVMPSWNDRDRRYPAVAYGATSALVAWQHARDATNYLDIWAQGVWPNARFLFLPVVTR